MYKLAAHLAGMSRWVQQRVDQGRRRGDDRGDISITTVIIWVAVVAGALVIAGTIGLVLTKYNGKLSGI
ncbi:MAG: hypothetical protein HOY69_30310 [Streptomyces sp.]|nr:hypothetical protein [Streptomyces sp.]